MFFTAFLVGTGVFLYYFPEDATKLLLPHLDKLHELGIEDNMVNKRSRGSNFDEVQRLELAKEYLTKGKQLFFILVTLSFLSSVIFGGVFEFLFGFGSSSSYKSDRNINYPNTVHSVYGYAINSASVVVVDGVNEDIAGQVDSRGTFNAANKIFYVPDETTSVRQLSAVAKRTVEILDEVPGIRAGINVVLSIISTRAPCDGHGHDETDLYAMQFENVRKQILRLYKTLIEYGMSEGKIVFAAVAKDDEESVLTRAAISAAVNKISSKRSSRLESYAAYGTDVSSAVDAALECFDNPARCSSVSLLESQARVMSFLASELMFSQKMTTLVNGAYSNSKGLENKVKPLPHGRHSHSDNEARSDARYAQPKLSFFSGLVVALTRLLCFIYPGTQTFVAFVSEANNENVNIKRRLWRQYWIIYAFACVAEDLVLKNLPFVLFLPGECLKMILLTKCLFPGPEASGIAYNTATTYIQSIINLVKEELEKQKTIKRRNSQHTRKGENSSSGKAGSKKAQVSFENYDDSDSDYPDPGEIDDAGTVPNPSSAARPKPTIRRRPQRRVDH